MLGFVTINALLIFVISIVPDVDLLISFMCHRGVTHSLLFAGIVSVICLYFYRRRIILYSFDQAQHSLIGASWEAVYNYFGLQTEVVYVSTYRSSVRPTFYLNGSFSHSQYYIYMRVVI